MCRCKYVAERININDKVASQLNSELQNVCELTNTCSNQPPTEKDVGTPSKKAMTRFLKLQLKKSLWNTRGNSSLVVSRGWKSTSDWLFHVHSKQPYNNIIIKSALSYILYTKQVVSGIIHNHRLRKTTFQTDT